MTLRLLYLGDPELADRYGDAARRLKGVEISAREQQGQGHLEDCLQNDNCDAVLLDGCQAAAFELIEMAAAKAKHVLVRDPISLDPSSIERLAALCDKHNRVVSFAPLSRFLPSLQEVHANVTANRLGAPGLLRIHHWRSGGDSPAPDMDSEKHLFAEADLACWYFDRAPNRVFAARSSVPAAPANYVQMHLGFSEGGMAIIDDAPAIAGAAGYFSLSLIGSSGAAYADDHHNTHLHFKSDGAAALLAGQGDLALVGQLAEFVERVAEGAGSNSCMRAAQVSRVVQAVRQSLASSDVVSIA